MIAVMVSRLICRPVRARHPFLFSHTFSNMFTTSFLILFIQQLGELSFGQGQGTYDSLSDLYRLLLYIFVLFLMYLIYFLLKIQFKCSRGCWKVIACTESLMHSSDFVEGVILQPPRVIF